MIFIKKSYNKKMTEEKSLTVKKENIFTKISNFFKNLFKVKSSKENVQVISEPGEKVENKEEDKNSFIQELRKPIEEENLVEDLKKNPGLLDSMSDEKLDEVFEIIKNKQQMLKQKIESLKKQINERKATN